MKKNPVKLARLFIMFLFLSLTSFVHADNTNTLSFEKIVFFGDSLSDKGNFYFDTLGFMPKSPPYFQGRFTNGMLWSEVVENYYQEKNSIITSNYAIGGQTAIFHNPMNGYLPYTLTMSLNKYLLGSIFRDRSKTLFLIWVGANDYLPAIRDVDDLTTKVTNSIASAVENLIYYGAVHILVINLPDLSLTPYARFTHTTGTLRSASLLHNLKLEAALIKLQEKNANTNIHLYYIDRQIKDFIDNPETPNKIHNTRIKNVTDSCWTGGYTQGRMGYPTEEMIADTITRHLQSLQHNKKMADNTSTAPNPRELARFIMQSPDLMETYAVSNPDQGFLHPCVDPDNYLFWDKIHPTVVAHKMIAADLISYINFNYSISNANLNDA